MEISESVGLHSTGLLGKCAGCSLALPLRLPEDNEQASHWVCTRCGASYRAVLLDNWPPEYRRNIRLAASPPDHKEPPVPLKTPASTVEDPDVSRFQPISIAFPDHPAVRCGLETSLSCRFDTEIERGVSLQARPQGKPFAGEIREHGATPYDKTVVDRFRGLVHQASGQVKDLFVSLKLGTRVELRVAELISRDGLFRVAEDKDLFVGLGIAPVLSGYPDRHALQVGMLATAIGATSGLDERALLDLGIGCLLHDVGMLSVDQTKYQGKRILSPAELADIANHPLLTLESLQRHLDLVPAAARMVAYQMHERCDGTGYPRGYAGDRIHELAKIAAVADVFVALVSPRPHRPGMVPYHALKKILNDTKRGLFDSSVVRGLLNAVSLFPIGSYVALNDGSVGKVIRTNGTEYDRPIVEAWKRSDFSGKASVVDLSQEQELAITNTLDRLDQ